VDRGGKGRRKERRGKGRQRERMERKRYRSDFASLQKILCTHDMKNVVKYAVFEII